MPTAVKAQRAYSPISPAPAAVSASTTLSTPSSGTKVTILSTGSAGIGGERLEVGEAEHAREGVGDPGRGDVRVGVGGVQAAARADQPVDHPALERGRGDAVHRPQQQRVVGQEEVRVPGDGLVDDGLDRVDGEQHAPDRRRGVAADQPDGVPVPRPRGVVHLLEHLDDLGQGRGAGFARHDADDSRPRCRARHANVNCSLCLDYAQLISLACIDADANVRSVGPAGFEPTTPAV